MVCPSNEADQRSIFIRLYSTTAINLVADAIAEVALPLAFLSSTGSVSLAAALTAATQIPQVLLTLPLSAIADRLPRKPLVIAGYIVEAACLGVLATVLGFGHVNLAIVVSLGVLRGTFSELGNSASAGYVPQVLGRENLLRYHARVETVEGGAAIVGPPISGGLVQVLGGPVALVFPAVASLVNAVVYLVLPNARLEDVGFRVARGAVGDRSSDPVQGWSNRADHERGGTSGPLPVGWTPLSGRAPRGHQLSCPSNIDLEVS